VLTWLDDRRLLVLAAALVLLAGALAVSGLSRREPSGIEFVYGSGLPPGSPIRVQVAGAVASPGVYELREGDRVVDALAAAGGPTTDADTDALNLARRVRDEERLEVPARAAARNAAPAPGAKLDINIASAEQLDALPGIGPAYARRIVDSRAVDGPYRSTRDLVDRKVLPQSTFDQIRDLIFVGP
jgi:competence protein ComEA